MLNMEGHTIAMVHAMTAEQPRDTIASLTAENERLREALNGFMNAEKIVLSDDNGTLFKVVTLTQNCWAKGYAALQPKGDK